MIKDISIFLIAVLALSFYSFAEEVIRNDVKIKGEKGNWHIEINGQEFYVQGAGCGFAKGKNGEDYLRLAKELGANTVRTWGIDQGTKEYLDTAHKYGIKVCAGIWINWVGKDGRPSYINNDEYKEQRRQEVLNYINEFKNHPAVILWGVGNEAICWTKSHQEKIAIAQFIESLITEIHKIDPSHPVVYASASQHEEIEIIKEYTPSLDILGVNCYGSIRFPHSAWQYLGFNIPYIITEFGANGPWDRPKDINGASVEQLDRDKARLYKEYLEQIFEFKGSNLGAFVFHLGETTQESMTWWNINEGELKRESFWQVRALYTGENFIPSTPRIKKFTLSKYKNIKPDEAVTVSVEAEGENLEYSYKISTAKEGVLEYYVNEWIDTQVEGKGRVVRIMAPQKEGIYRVYCFVKDGQGNITSSNSSIRVTGK